MTETDPETVPAGQTEWLATKPLSLARHCQRHADANPGTSLWA